jgi:hypothetical protein
VEVFGMSELTDWERHRLADLERQLGKDDPQLAALLTRPLRPGHPRVPSWAGWALGVVGFVLLLCGSTLRDHSTMALGIGLLALCWVPGSLARTAARNARP